MSEIVYVYGNRAFSSAAAAGHHPRLRERLSRQVLSLQPGARLLFHVTTPWIDRLTVDEVEMCRIVAKHPEAKVDVLPIEQAGASA
ncbi:MAG: hypothetical protein KDA49_13245 [Rhodospirillaceae bacterium]|nr:hypothetical protein [Rhodospirillaceae bacterium]MCA8933435.1 hypothetical protein [Rhodospirillaceae bacterium]